MGKKPILWLLWISSNLQKLSMFDASESRKFEYLFKDIRERFFFLFIAQKIK